MSVPEGLFQRIVAVQWRTDPLVVPALPPFPAALITEPVWTATDVTVSDGDFAQRDSSISVNGSIVHAGGASIVFLGSGCSEQTFSDWVVFPQTVIDGEESGSGKFAYEVWNGFLANCDGIDTTVVQEFTTYDAALATRDASAMESDLAQWDADLDAFDATTRGLFAGDPGLLAQYDAGLADYRDTVDTEVQGYIDQVPQTSDSPDTTTRDAGLHEAVIDAVTAARDTFQSLVSELEDQL